MLSSFGLGCWALGGDSYGIVNEKEARLLLDTAYDCGVKFFDTSPAYGEGLSEERIGKYLSKKQNIKIATKVGMLPHSSKIIPYDFSSTHIVNSINSSLKRLQIDALDLVQLHSPIIGFEQEFSDVFVTLNSLVSNGKVKNFGISLRSPSNFSKQLNLYDWKSFQYNFSILDQRIIADMKRIVLNSNKDKLFVARTPLNFGFLTESPPELSKLTSKHHLKGWENSQFVEWESKVQIIKNIIKKYDYSLLQTALRFPVDSRFSNLVIPGARNQLEFLDNFKAFNLGKICKELILELRQQFNLSEKNTIETPYKYIKNET